MIYDRKCAVVVMVSGLVEEGQEASAQYWPDSGLAQFGEFTVNLTAKEELEGFTLRKMTLAHTKVPAAEQQLIV